MTETLIVGATMAVSLGSALLMQKALLGAMLYAIDPKDKPDTAGKATSLCASRVSCSSTWSDAP
jgi:hypothetical protein